MTNKAFTQPTCVVSASGSPIDFKGRLVSVTVHDEAGFANDRCDIELDDSDPGMSTPPDGLQISVSMGYTDPGAQMYDKGQYVFDESERLFNPQILVLRFHAFDTGGNWKSNQETSYHSTTVGDIANTIGQRQGVQVNIDAALAAIPVPHRDQTSESDMSFIMNLAAQHNASVKIANGALNMAPRGQTKSISGQDVASVDLSLKDCEHAMHLHHSRGDYGSVGVNYNNQDTGQQQTEKVTGNSSSTASNTTAALEPTKDEAASKAQATNAAMARNTDTFQFTCFGLPQIAAESFLNLVDFKRDVPTNWLVSQCETSFKPEEGFKTTGTCEVPDSPGSTDAATTSSETQATPAASSNNAGNNDNLGDFLTLGQDSNVG